jgi:5-methylcytosine-specific restriction endonuclease McrA
MGKTFVCTVCGTQFEKKGRTGPKHPKSCSIACNQLLQCKKRADKLGYAHQPSTEGQIQYCARCGQGFIARGRKANKYCPECKYPVQLARTRIENKKREEAHKAIPIPDRQCERCGQTYQSWHSRRKFCIECGPIAKIERNNERAQIKRQQQNAEDGVPNATGRDGRAMHILRKIHGCVPITMYEHINVRKVYVRDAWICGICGELIDKDARFPLPMSPSVDHIVPLTKGGAHLYANVQAAHLRCNIAKGNGDRRKAR